MLNDAATVWHPAPEVFFFAKGRVALFAILRAMGIGPGDEVLVPGYTCVVVPAAICYTGARPVYYDIDLQTYCGSVSEAASRITERTRAVVIQHTYGIPIENTALIELCHERGIHIIEDCAHAMGGSLDDKPLGTMSDAAFASYQWSKPVTVGLGGVARINNEKLLAPMRAISSAEFSEPSLYKMLLVMFMVWAHNAFLAPRLYWTARAGYHALGRLGLASPSSTTEELTEPATMPPGYCERFGRLRMGQLMRAIQRLPDTVAHGNRIADIYENWCRDRDIETPKSPTNSTPVYLRFPILVQDRATMLETAQSKRVELGDWFNAPLHPDIDYSPELGYYKGMCPNAEYAAKHVVNLPTHRRIDGNEAERVLMFLADHDAQLIRSSRIEQESGRIS